MKKSPSQGSRVGLKQIAAEAKVSIATVSRVLNGNNRVDPAIQMAVLDAAAKFDLDLLQRNKARALAFLLSNRVMLHPFHSRILSGAEGYCAAQGWDIVFLSFNYPLNAHWDRLHLPKILERRDAIRAVAKLKQPGALIKERLQTMSRLDKDSLARDLASKALARLGGTE